MNDLTIIPMGPYTQQKSMAYDEMYGMGFLPAVAAAPAAGPAAPVVAVAGVVASVLGKLFGFGKDDQKTNYRPPANTAQRPVQIGNDLVSFDMSDLRLANAKGNRTDDLFSYYSAFASNSVDAGASKAAKKVITDAARKYGWSISQAAAVILETAGVRKIVQPVQQPGQSFLPSQPVELPKAPPLINIADAIAAALSKLVKPPGLPRTTATRPGDVVGQMPPPPPPPPAPGGQTTQQQRQRSAGQIARDLAIAEALRLGQMELAALLRKRQQVADQAAAYGCNPDAQFYDPRSGQCLTLVGCPSPDQYFDPAAGACITPGADLSSFLDRLGNIGGIPVWLLLAAGLVVVASSGGGKTVSFRSKR